MKKKQFLFLIIGIMILCLSGCNTTRYKLDLGGYDFVSERTSYAAGEKVTVIYDMIATDTDYSFYTDSEDVELEQDYDEKRGYVLTFKMPAHDVKLGVRSRNTMEWQPSAEDVMKVDKEILMKDIRDFYYTKSNINYDAFYQRYRFYVEGGKNYFFHETRERKGKYGPCTEADTTLKGTVELTGDQWKKFYELVSGGTVEKREESADAGGSGPWLYLYWTNDRDSIQQFSFESYKKEKEFVGFCKSLAEG